MLIFLYNKRNGAQQASLVCVVSAERISWAAFFFNIGVRFTGKNNLSSILFFYGSQKLLMAIYLQSHWSVLNVITTWTLRDEEHWAQFFVDLISIVSHVSHLFPWDPEVWTRRGIEYIVWLSLFSPFFPWWLETLPEGSLVSRPSRFNA